MSMNFLKSTSGIALLKTFTFNLLKNTLFIMLYDIIIPNLDLASNIPTFKLKLRQFFF